MDKIAVFEGKPVIAVGGGRIVWPGEDTGSGHFMPAKAINEALEAHPDVRAGKVLVQPILAENWHLGRTARLAPHRDLSVVSGFSGIPGDFYWKTAPAGVTQSATARARYKDVIGQVGQGRVIKYVPDTRPRISIKELPGIIMSKYKDIVGQVEQARAIKHGPRVSAGIGTSVSPGIGIRDIPDVIRVGLKQTHRAMGAVRDYFNPDVLTFGNPGQSFIGTLRDKLLGRPLFSSPKISPALTNEALAGIQEALNSKATAAELYGRFAEHLDSIGNTQAAKYIRRGIEGARRAGREYKPILLTGSSRGDFVGQRAMDIKRLLRQHKLHGQYHVVPILGRGVDVAGQLADAAKLPKIPGIPAKLYNLLRGAAALNLASTGASDINEIKALGAPAMFDLNQLKIKYRELKNLRNLTPEQVEQLRKVETYLWNLGNMQDIVNARAQGLAGYESLDEVIERLKDPEFMDKSKAMQRGRDYYSAALQAKQDMANKLVRAAKWEARKSQWVARNPRIAKLLSGKGLALAGGITAGAGIAAYLAHRALSSKKREAAMAGVKKAASCSAYAFGHQLVKQATRWREEVRAGRLKPGAEYKLVHNLDPTYRARARAYKYNTRLPVLGDVNRFMPSGVDVGDLEKSILSKFSPQELGLRGTSARLPISQVLGEGVESMALRLPTMRALKLTKGKMPESALNMPIDLTAGIVAPRQVATASGGAPIYASIEHLARPGANSSAAAASGMTYSGVMKFLRKLDQAGYAPHDLPIYRMDQLGVLPSGEVGLLDRGSVVPKGVNGTKLFGTRAQTPAGGSVLTLSRMMKENPRLRKDILSGKSTPGVRAALISSFKNPMPMARHAATPAGAVTARTLTAQATQATKPNAISSAAKSLSGTSRGIKGGLVGLGALAAIGAGGYGAYKLRDWWNNKDNAMQDGPASRIRRRVA